MLRAEVRSVCRFPRGGKVKTDLRYEEWPLFQTQSLRSNVNILEHKFKIWSHEPFLQKIMSEYNDWQNKPRFLIKNNSSRFSQAWQNFFPVFPIQTWTLNPLIWHISPVYVVIFAVNCQPVHHTNILPALINLVLINKQSTNIIFYISSERWRLENCLRYGKSPGYLYYFNSPEFGFCHPLQFDAPAQHPSYIVMRIVCKDTKQRWERKGKELYLSV